MNACLYATFRRYSGLFVGHSICRSCVLLFSHRFYGIETHLARSGCEKSDPLTGAVVSPIHLSTTFERDDSALLRDFDYARSCNPTRKLLETSFANLECAKESFACSSGMQAVLTLLLSCPRAHVVLPNDLYHGVIYVYCVNFMLLFIMCY